MLNVLWHWVTVLKKLQNVNASFHDNMVKWSELVFICKHDGVQLCLSVKYLLNHRRWKCHSIMQQKGLERVDLVLSLMDYHCKNFDVMLEIVMTSECAQLSLEVYIVFDHVITLGHIYKLCSSKHWPCSLALTSSSLWMLAVYKNRAGRQ